MSEAKTKQAVRAYIKIRDDIKAHEKTFKEFKAEQQEKLDQLSNFISAQINELGGDSLKTSEGTAFMSTVTRTSVEDWSVFTQYIADELVKNGGDVFAFFNKSVNKTAVLQFMSDNEDALPPGIKYDAFKELKVNRPR